MSYFIRILKVKKFFYGIQEFDKVQALFPSWIVIIDIGKIETCEKIWNSWLEVVNSAEILTFKEIVFTKIFHETKDIDDYILVVEHSETTFLIHKV